MKNRDDSIIRKIYEYCGEVESTIDYFGSEDEFGVNKIYRNAACMPILHIGELCKLISDEMRINNRQIDWRGWCGVRDIMAHQYTNLDYKKTWEIITVDLPILKNKLSDIIKVYDEEAIERIKNIINENNLENINAFEVFHKIVDNTGVSLSMFSDEKIVEFIKEMM